MGSSGDPAHLQASLVTEARVEGGVMGVGRQGIFSLPLLVPAEPLLLYGPQFTPPHVAAAGQGDNIEARSLTMYFPCSWPSAAAHMCKLTKHKVRPMGTTSCFPSLVLWWLRGPLLSQPARAGGREAQFPCPPRRPLGDTGHLPPALNLGTVECSGIGSALALGGR